MEVVQDNADVPPSEVQLQIAAIIELFKLHMQHEDEYMASIDYPYAMYHKQHHVEFLQMLIDYKKSVTKWSLLHTTRQLVNHFMAHIDHHDIQLAQYAK